MNPLVRSGARQKDLGEVFTPDDIIHRMLALTPDSLWSDPNHLVIEPACGNGNFIVAIISKKIANGLTVCQALQTTFGIDIMSDNIMDCHNRIFKLFIEGTLSQQLLVAIMFNNIFQADATTMTSDQIIIFDDKSEEDRKKAFDKADEWISFRDEYNLQMKNIDESCSQ